MTKTNQKMAKNCFNDVIVYAMYMYDFNDKK